MASSVPIAIERPGEGIAGRFAPLFATAIAFAVLFAKPAAQLVQAWWSNPEAGHGLLLAPIALWLAWRTGVGPDARPNLGLGLPLVALAVLLRLVSGLAAEVFTMNFSLVFAAGALTVCYFGFRQVIRWWLPFTLLALSIPLPALIAGALALPLQFKASQMGAALLRARNVPVLLTGNVIRLPGHELFVTEACSGLRSLTALLSLGVLLGGLLLRSVASRVALLLVAVAIAVLVNGVRVFLTGFLVYFVSPAMGQGFMHLTEGWLLFLVSFSVLALAAWLAGVLEHRIRPRQKVA